LGYRRSSARNRYAHAWTLCRSRAAAADQPALLHLRVPRFFRGSADFGKRTFAEQINGLTFRHGSCTLLLRRVREALALALDRRSAPA
jgi:hypothetical protein